MTLEHEYWNGHLSNLNTNKLDWNPKPLENIDPNYGILGIMIFCYTLFL